jgi:uncharacterized protein YyaL (SSP411 family)
MHAFLLATLLLAAPPPVPLDAALLNRLAARVEADYDTSQRAFARHDGTLDLPALELSLRLARRPRPDTSAWRARALNTLAWAGGLYDSVGGGYVRSLRDKDPSHPTFEKWLADNVGLVECHLDAFWLTGDEQHSRLAREVVAYVQRAMVDPRGGFMPGRVWRQALWAEPTGRGARAYLRFYRASGERSWREFALRSLDRTWESSWDSTLGFVRLAEVGPGTAGHVVDLVTFGEGLLEAYEIAQRPADLARARLLGDFLLARAEDPEKGGFFSTASIAQHKLFKVQRRTREPEENGSAAEFLFHLGEATGERRFADAGRRALAVFAPAAVEKGDAAAECALALDRMLAPPPPRPQAPEVTEPSKKPPRSKRYR